MEWVEVTGKSLPEAKDKALDYLGVDETQAEFEILEEPRVGLFRRVKGEARVRARIKPSHPRPKAERRDRRRNRPRDGAAADSRDDEAKNGEGRPAGGRPVGGGRSRGNDGAGRSGSNARSGAAPGARRRPRGDAPAVVAATADAAAVEPADFEPAADGTERTEDLAPAAGAPSPLFPDSSEPVNREEPLSEMTEEDRNEGPADDGRQTEHAAEFLTGLVEAFGLSATVTSATVDENYDEVRIEGADLGILIGPRAAALDSIQELTRVVAQRRSGGRGESRLRIDIGGYRQRRREALERFAIKLAEEVRSTGVIKALEPMTSADRKVVHDIVGTLEGVATLSEGEDPRRRVVIVPAT